MRNSYLILSAIVLALSVFLIATSENPGYTDAYYYFNAGQNLAEGDGLTDDALWVYVNAGDDLPTESHRYWMPLASIVAAVPMVIFGSTFSAAQVAFVPFWMGLAWLAMWLGWRVGGTMRHAWVAALTVVLGGFYFPFWLTTDTFALFGLVGALAMVALGLGAENGDWRWFALAGALTGLAHLARADGPLFLIVGLIVIWLPVIRQRRLGKSALQTATLILAYVVVMLPWFIRNMSVFDAPLPSGGIGTAYLHEYNDIFSYPAEWDLQYFLDWGAGNILRSRLDGLLVMFQTWLAVEALIVLAPFALWALWKRRAQAFFGGVLWYALGLHLAMSLVFTYPGNRGGLFHSSSALLPFWVALGLAGLDDGIAWLAARRKWRAGEAKRVFGTAVVLLPLALGIVAWNAQQANRDANPDYERARQTIGENEARIMVNDPAGWHYHTGWLGVTLPQASLATTEEIAQRYCLTHLIIDENVTDAFLPLIRDEEDPPEFLVEVAHFSGTDSDEWSDDMRIYEFEVTCDAS